MKELLRRLFLHPRLAWEIIVASFFVNVLSLASPIFSIQVLNRYIGYGFDGTLFTLTLGMLIAAVLGFCFSRVRHRLASAVSLGPDRELADIVFRMLSQVRLQVLQQISPAKVQETVSGLHAVQAALGASGITAVLDMPFFLIFFLAVLLLSPILAFVTLLCMAATVLAGCMAVRSGRAGAQKLQEAAIGQRALVTQSIDGAETIRAFLAGPVVRRQWDEQVDALAEQGMRTGDQRMGFQGLAGGIGLLLRTLIYVIGAIQVVRGELTVGGLIGVSILSSKAVSMSMAFMQAMQALDRSDAGLKSVNEFLKAPVESASGAALRQFSGRVEFKDVGFFYPASPMPLFESLDLALQPGDVLAVHGHNGSGKTTFVKTLIGLLVPGRGQILVDGVEMRQLAMEWWRRQVVYVPQDPVFLNLTYRENIMLANPEMDQERLNAVVRAAGLKKTLDMSREGLETRIFDMGRELPAGIRRRLALARGLAVPGRLVVLDEPTEGLDDEGVQAVRAVVQALVRQGHTIVMVTRDQALLQYATLSLDLNEKPRPRIESVKPTGGAA